MFDRRLSHQLDNSTRRKEKGAKISQESGRESNHLWLTDPDGLRFPTKVPGDKQQQERQINQPRRSRFQSVPRSDSGYRSSDDPPATSQELESISPSTRYTHKRVMQQKYPELRDKEKEKRKLHTEKKREMIEKIRK